MGEGRGEGWGEPTEPREARGRQQKRKTRPQNDNTKARPKNKNSAQQNKDKKGNQTNAKQGENGYWAVAAGSRRANHRLR